MQRGVGKAAQYVLDVVQELGFDPSSSSRLAYMKRLFARKDFVKETDPEFEFACEALRDITLLEFALEQLKGTVPEETLRSKVELIVKDKPLPQNEESPNTPGRNAQTELHVAGVCQAAGLNPQFAEPDIVATTDSGRWGLAVKRLKSLKQLEKRFKKATHQIDAAGVPGFVVLDMVLALNPENKRLWFIVPEDDFGQAQGTRFKQFYLNHEEAFRKWRRGREVRGVIILDHLVCKISDRDWGLRSFTFLGLLDSHNQSRKRGATQFWKAYVKGIPYSSTC